MIDGNELDLRAREIAKKIDECPIDDIQGIKVLLAKAEEVRLDFAEWIEENQNA